MFCLLNPYIEGGQFPLLLLSLHREFLPILQNHIYHTALLIFAFSYFYTEITMNPEEIANNIKKSGGNIAGIRAGSSTAEYLRKQMKYLIAIGSFCLCIIAIIPFIVSGLTSLSRLSFFGTSIIITVSVILETKKLILSKTQENYYMNRVKKGGLFRG